MNSAGRWFFGFLSALLAVGPALASEITTAATGNQSPHPTTRGQEPLYDDYVPRRYRRRRKEHQRPASLLEAARGAKARL